MNNNIMTLEEMANVAQSIMLEEMEELEEINDPTEETKEFMDLYTKMLDMLKTLQGSIIQVQKGKKASGEPGSGSFTKAYNASIKLENEIKVINKITLDFIKSMRQFLADTKEI